MLARAVAVLAFLAALPAPASAGFVVELEASGQMANNSLATAQNVQAGLDAIPPATAFVLPGSFLHASIAGIGGSDGADTDVDFYRFETTGGRAYFDLDTAPALFDATLTVFDATGTLIAFGDDSFPEDEGSEIGLDPFIGVTTLPPGTYYVAVTGFGNFPNGLLDLNATFDDLFRPDGETGGIRVTGATAGDSSFFSSGSQPDGGPVYTLNISLEAAAVPAPPSLVLGLIGAGTGVLTSMTVRRRGRA